MLRFAIIFFLVPFFSVPVFAQGDWSLKRDEDGIKVYTRNSDNSSFKSVKVECNVNTTRSQLVAFLFDVDKQGEWVANYKGSRLIKRVCDSEIIFYSEVSVPWPCTNRDYVSHITVTQPSRTVMVIKAHSEPDLVPKKEGKVRIQKSNANWEVTALGPSEQRIVYTVQFDPAGSVPAWLVNMFVTKAPYETFKKLREGVNKPEYKNAHLDFIKE